VAYARRILNPSIFLEMITQRCLPLAVPRFGPLPPSENSKRHLSENSAQRFPRNNWKLRAILSRKDHTSPVSPMFLDLYANRDSNDGAEHPSNLGMPQPTKQLDRDSRTERSQDHSLPTAVF
jgi:hypothetical protein